MSTVSLPLSPHSIALPWSRQTAISKNSDGNSRCFGSPARRSLLCKFEFGHDSFDPISISFLVISTSPRICVHSETMLPTTCPHLLLGSIALNATTQPTPVIRRNKVSECSRKNSSATDCHFPFGFLLSAEPFS